MPLIEGKCKNCGGKLGIADGKNGICPFCGTSYIAEDVINYNNYNINNAVLSIDLTDTIEQKLGNADTYLEKFKNYAKAYEIYKEVTELTANDYRGWWGLVRAKTEDFTKAEIGSATMQQLTTYANYAISVADKSKKTILQQTFNAYLAKAEKRKNQKTSELHTAEKQIEVIKEKQVKVKSELDAVKKQNGTANARLIIIKEFYINLILICATIILFLFFAITQFTALLVFSVLSLAGTAAMLIFTSQQRDTANKCVNIIAKKEEELNQLSSEITALQSKISAIKTSLSA